MSICEPSLLIFARNGDIYMKRLSNGKLQIIFLISPLKRVVTPN